MSQRSYWLRIGKLSINVTNRMQMFEERRLPSFRGWWVNVIWRKV
jgi:hypothetical protein